MKLYILRHGVTEYNKLKRLQGVKDIPLCEEGREQARKAGLTFQEIPFDLCLTSPLSRARETAELFLGGRGVPILEEPLLKEISFGNLEGEVFSASGEWELQRLLKLFFKEPERYPRPQGGEDLLDVTKRAERLLRKLEETREYEEASLLLSTHACFSRALLQGLPGSTLKDYWRGAVPPNCSLSCMELEQGKRRLLFQDKTA